MADDTGKQGTGPVYMGTGEVARLFGRSPETIRQWCREGVIPHRRMRGRLLFLRDEIDQVIHNLPGLALAPPAPGDDAGGGS